MNEITNKGSFSLQRFTKEAEPKKHGGIENNV